MLSTFLWPVKAAIWVVCGFGLIYNPFKGDPKLDQYEDLYHVKISPMYGVSKSKILSMLEELGGVCYKGDLDEEYLQRFREVLDNPLKGCCGGMTAIYLVVPKKTFKRLNKSGTFDVEVKREILKEDQYREARAKEVYKEINLYIKSTSPSINHSCKGKGMYVTQDGECNRCGAKVIDFPRHLRKDIEEFDINNWFQVPGVSGLHGSEELRDGTE